MVEYDAGLQARAAAEVQALPEGSAIVEMLSDYAVMREQARGCNFPQLIEMDGSERSTR